MSILILSSGSPLIESATLSVGTDIILYDPVRRGLGSKIIDRIAPSRTTSIVLHDLHSFFQKIRVKVEAVIIFDSELWMRRLPRLRNIFSGQRVIYFFWNTVNSDSQIAQLRKFNFDIATFDPSDAMSFSLRFTDQFYWPDERFSCQPPGDSSHDTITAFFCGRKKGREEDLLWLQHHLKAEHVLCNFSVLGPADQLWPYHKVRSEIMASDIVIDINKPGQSGKSLRPLEALYYRKKLISNSLDNDEVFNESVLLHTRKIADLAGFLQVKPTTNWEAVEEFMFESWLQRVLH